MVKQQDFSTAKTRDCKGFSKGNHIILRWTSMTLGGVLTGEQVRLQAFDGGGCWDLTEKMDDQHLRKNPLATANYIHYSSSDTYIVLWPPVRRST